MLKTLAFIMIFAVTCSHQWGLLATSYRQDLAQLVTQPSRLELKSELSPETIRATALQSWQLPTARPDAQVLTLPVKGAIAIDRATGSVLYEQNADAKLPIASLTKLVSALVVLSERQSGDTITVPTLPTYQTADARAGLITGEHFTVEQLMAALLIPSANDAADALAIELSGSIEEFSHAQNAKASYWGLTATHLSNASGLTDDNNYSTARDLSKIAKLALTNQLISSLVNQSSATITNQEGKTYQFVTTNQLLSIKDFHGIKTGYTAAAGQCYIGLVTINGHDVITVVLGAQDRFGNTKTLTDWIKNTWQWL